MIEMPYYFVVIKYRMEDEKKFDAEWQINLSEEQLRRRYVSPYINETQMIISGRKVPFSAICEMHIAETEKNIGGIGRFWDHVNHKMKLWFRDVDESVKNPSEPQEWKMIMDAWREYVYEHGGIEVTADFLTIAEKVTEKQSAVLSRIRNSSIVEAQSENEKMIKALPNVPTPSLSLSEEARTKVFVVHGRDEAMKQAVARTIEQLELKPIILHEEADQGRTIIEKFTQCSDVGFSVVLMSPDDLAYPKEAKPEEAKLRARQNVILELGYFLGKLGRKNVMALYKQDKDFEIPTDFAGVVYTSYDSQGYWKLRLVKELRACGYNVDANKIV